LKLDEALTAKKIYSMRKIAQEKGYIVKSKYTSSGAYLEIQVSPSESTKAADGLKQMINDFPDMIDEKEIQAVSNWIKISDPLRLLPRGNGDFQTLYDYVEGKQAPLKVTLSCSLENKETPKCDIEVKESK
jgi:hypothetical protein